KLGFPMKSVSLLADVYKIGVVNISRVYINSSNGGNPWWIHIPPCGRDHDTDSNTFDQVPQRNKVGGIFTGSTDLLIDYSLASSRKQQVHLLAECHELVDAGGLGVEKV